ncbi:M48 family metalloprotease [Microbispora bryophytorum]|nr:M48 family metalloprotease [Microbispora bryophytorum]
MTAKRTPVRSSDTLTAPPATRVSATRAPCPARPGRARPALITPGRPGLARHHRLHFHHKGGAISPQRSAPPMPKAGNAAAGFSPPETAGKPGNSRPAGIGELPAILDALRAAADHLHTFLADKLIGNTLAVYALIQARRSGTTPSLERTAATAGPSAPAELNPGQGRLLDQAIAVLTERLIAYGLSRERAEQQTYRLLETIFEPGNTLEEVQALLAALLATDPAQPLPEPRLGGRPRSWMLPPWLWFYLIAYLLVGVPWLIGDWTRQATDYWTLITNSPLGVARTAGIVLGVASIAQLFPVLILCGAVASLLLPGFRGQRVERRHGLRVSDNPVIEEIGAFVRRQDPSIEIRFSESTRMPARVYPVGWNKARIAVFLPLTVLWRADREAAEAVLLHEIAHRRQLDHHVVGLASPFTWLVRAWGPVFVLVGLLPITLYVVLGGARRGAPLRPHGAGRGMARDPRRPARAGVGPRPARIHAHR